MNKNLKIIMLPLFICLAVSLFAGGRREAKNSQGKKVQVSGTVRLVGSEPFPDMVITGQNAEWYIDRQEMHKLKELQNRVVTVEGIEYVRNLRFANGLPAGERRTLKDIKIISTQ